jgi:hypothetical protein
VGEIITHLLFGIYLDVSRLNETKKVLAIFGFMCYHIFRKGKENPKNQKGKNMTVIEFLNKNENKNELKGKILEVRGANSKNWWDNTERVLEKVGISTTHIYLYV